MMQYLNQKADKSTTLEGYGITDAYSKTQADGRFVKNGQSQININDGDIILDTENSDGDLFVKNQSGMAADVHAKDFEASGGHKLSNKNNKPIVLTQAEYDALVTKDPNQDYYIPED
jgi:K+-transporting ATPase c subunit